MAVWPAEWFDGFLLVYLYPAESELYLSIMKLNKVTCTHTHFTCMNQLSFIKSNKKMYCIYERHNTFLEQKITYIYEHAVHVMDTTNLLKVGADIITYLFYL